MIREAYERGRQAALARFKIANAIAGAAAYNPSLNPRAAGGNNLASSAMTASVPKPPTAPGAPVASGAAKANVLG